MGELHEIAIIPYLITYVVGSDEVAQAAQKAVSAILREPVAEDLLNLDEELRCSYPWWHWKSWRGLKTSQIRMMKVADAEAPSVFGVLTCHPSGYVREAAVQQLDRITDGREIPYLLIRLNDWVSTVRKVARASILRRLEAGQFSGFFANLHLVLRLSDCGRDDHAPIVDRVINKLSAPESGKSLSAAIASSSRFVWRKAYRAAMSGTGPHRRHVVELGLSSRDGVLRLWAVRDAVEEMPDLPLRAALESLNQDTFMPVRRESIRCTIERYPDDASAALRIGLFDPSRSVRDFCRFYLRSDKELDYAELYRQSLDHGEHLHAAVAGLGETGTPEDADRLLPYLSHQRTQLRAAAVRAVGSLAGHDHVDDLISALQDDSKKVTCEAVKCLRASNKTTN